MRRDEVKELHYFAAISNTPSMLSLGILSHNRARRVPHVSIADEGVNSWRDGKLVPGGRRLHDYANFYFNPRNPMMYARQELHEECCILRIDTGILDLPGVVVTDKNAARYCTYRPVEEGLALVDAELTFAQYWNHPDPIEKDRRKAAECAEVLVPDVVSPDYIRGAYASCEAAERALRAVGFSLPITLKPYLFFR